MVGRPLRPPSPLRLRPNGGLDRPRFDRRVRPGAARAVSFLVSVPPRDSAPGPVGDPRLSRSDRDVRLLLHPRDPRVAVRDRRDDADPPGRTARHPDSRMVQQPHPDRGEFVYPDGVGRGQVRRRRAGCAEPVGPDRARAKRDLDAADMDVVWLLNAFAASEIPYSAGSLSTYVDGLRPGGIVLDYDYQPRTRDAWMQAGTQAIAPTVRSTHFWTTADNVLGKLDTSIVARGAPNFLWLTVYTFRFDLRDARALVDELSRRMGGDLEVVTPTQFFGLLRADFIQTAHTRLAATDGDPVASLLFPGLMESARSHLRDADASLAGGEANRGAYAAYLGLADLRSASSSEALLTSLLVVLAAAVLAFIAHRSSRSAPHSPERLRLGVLLGGTAAVALLLFALREALDQNFWTYPTIPLGGVP